MFPKPSRRWFQFSIRSLLIVITVVSVAAGRTTYLQRQAGFHENEAKQIRAKMDREFEIEKVRREAREREQNFYPCSLSLPGSREDWERLEVHKYLMRQYRRALFRPWTTVNESPTLEELYADP